MTAHAKEVADPIPQNLSPDVIRIHSSEKRAVSEILTCPGSPQCSAIRREKSLEERLISGGDKHVSWQEGREEKTFSRCVEKAKAICQQKAAQPCLGAKLARSCSAVNSLRYCFTDKSEDGLPIRRVLRQSPRRPMAENIERNLPMYQSTME